MTEKRERWNRPLKADPGNCVIAQLRGTWRSSLPHTHATSPPPSPAETDYVDVVWCCVERDLPEVEDDRRVGDKMLAKREMFGPTCRLRRGRRGRPRAGSSRQSESWFGTFGSLGGCRRIQPSL
jgi:hypothetical protein